MGKIEDENIETDMVQKKVTAKKTSKRKTAKSVSKEKLSQFSIEEMFEQLDNIIYRMENENLSLEESFAEYERGVKLVKSCNNQIEKIEKKIIVLSGEERADEL